MARESNTIELSKKHGLNPSILHCFICGKETGIALMGRLKGDAEAPRDVSNPNEICDDCRKMIDAGNKFFMEVKDNTDEHNPERTGRYVCIKGSALPEVKSPINYMEHTVYDKLFGKL